METCKHDLNGLCTVSTCPDPTVFCHATERVVFTEELIAENARQQSENKRLLTRISEQDQQIGRLEGAQLQGNVEGYAMRCRQLQESNERLQAEAAALREAACLARSALDGLMGDSDLIGEEDDSPEFIAMQKLSAVLNDTTAGAAMLRVVEAARELKNAMNNRDKAQSVTDWIDAKQGACKNIVAALADLDKGGVSDGKLPAL